MIHYYLALAYLAILLLHTDQSTIQNEQHAKQEKESSASGMFYWRFSHQDKHQYGQDVEDSIAKQRPPAQRDGLEREDTHRTFLLAESNKLRGM